MKIFKNGTEFDPGEIMETAYLPTWLMVILCSVLIAVIFMKIICYRYCPKCTNGFKTSSLDCGIGCKYVCQCIAGCLQSCSYNCGLFVDSYKTCVDKTHECFHYRPNMNRTENISANNRAESERGFSNVPRRPNMPELEMAPIRSISNDSN